MIFLASLRDKSKWRSGGSLSDLGVHAGGEHVAVVPTDGLIPPQVVANLVPAELDAGARDHPRPVVRRLLPHPEESLKASPGGEVGGMAVSCSNGSK